jgi:hypothetical protein
MKNHIAISVLLAVIAGVIYTQTLGFDFVNYDDPSYVYKKASPPTRSTGR